MKVKLRTQEQKGRIYFYTDIFYGYVTDKNGKKKPKRKRKSLELSYPVNCTNPFDRKQKKEAIRLADLKVLKLETKWVGKGLNEKLINIKNKKTIISIDKRFFRPSEVDHLKGNFSNAKNELKWTPKTNFTKLVELMILSDLEHVQNSN